MEWLVSLHDEDAPELIDLNTFMQALQKHFKYPLAARHAETRVFALKQGKQLVTEYIQDFHQLISHLGDWPEHLLVTHFRDGLNKELYHICLSRGVP